MVILGKLAFCFDEYVAFYGTRSGRSGGNVYVEVFPWFDGEKRMMEVQEIIDSMKARLEQEHWTVSLLSCQQRHSLGKK